MKKTSFKNLCFATLVALLPLAAPAAEQPPGFAALSERWLNERDECIETISDTWLENQRDPALKGMLLRLITLEVRLSTREDMYLYTAQLGTIKDLDGAVRTVALDYLETTGWDPNSGRFVEGRQFDVKPAQRRQTLVPQPTQDTTPPPQTRSPSAPSDESAANRSPAQRGPRHG
ncbi:hypothetical protein [Ruficoccus sp. ZRK36]|uniref:hypothetical protein n=1 Tax=Ruficoccus sp. ZRK36 TaxID=2866311 RepID=UPI001C739F1B|nr:hypothetical protein [Ruficoccus sp. ZRK36]QYY37312.1 hypothetical protein K0V07_07455 [Ruficoccus sp. ZRK36]